MSEKIINHDGDTWRIVSTGKTNDAGATYCHLASMTRFVEQRNGSRAVQICDYIPADVLAQNPVRRWDMAITQHYTDRANGGHAALAG